MKAAVTKGDGKIELIEVPRPRPDSYQCLCKILAAATCSGTDQKIMADKLPWEQDYPGILGHESVGRVVKVGKKVRNIKEGEIFLRPTAVYPGEKLGDYYSLWGGFAEYGLVTDTRALREEHPETELNNYTRYQQKLPPGFPISLVDATMLITLKEAASFVANAGITLSQSLVILGSGSVALSMCRFAKIFGAYPVMVVGRRHKPLRYAERIGADFTVNTQENNFVEKVRGITQNRGVDGVIDTTGDVSLVKESLGVLSTDGKIIPYATYEASDTIRKSLPVDKVLSTGPSEERAHRYLIDTVRLGWLRPANFYSHRLPFSEIRAGFELLRKKEAFKIVFKMEETKR